MVMTGSGTEVTGPPQRAWPCLTGACLWCADALWHELRPFYTAAAGWYLQTPVACTTGGGLVGGADGQVYMVRDTSHTALKVLVQLSVLYHQPFSLRSVCVKRVVFQVLTCSQPNPAVITGFSGRPSS
jgi:hypothetical protein